MADFKLPLSNTPEKFEISLADKNYLMTVKWNDSDEGGWMMDLEDATTNVSIVAGIPLITGADLLEGLDYLGIEGHLYVYTDGDTFATPTLLNLGVESNVYFQTEVIT